MTSIILIKLQYEAVAPDLIHNNDKTKETLILIFIISFSVLILTGILCLFFYKKSLKQKKLEAERLKQERRNQERLAK